jgi:hypothetical protein
MPLSWNEIKDRAIRFSKEWETETSEDAEAKTFWDDFFNVFGVNRRKMASFEKPVKRLDESTGYIDLLWKGTILVEHKSRGKDLDKAYKQALDYFPGLKDYELPKYVLVSDFARFRLYDLDTGTQSEFLLQDLYKNVKHFGFIAGYHKHEFHEQDPVNIRAAELMGKLHDRLKEIGYTGHPLEVYLVRLLFCLFAEDTSIFEKDQFRDYIWNKTKEDGSDLAHHLATLFYVLNTPKEKRLTNLDEELAAFHYVNGKLFEEQLPPASFDSRMREILLECTALDWGAISPAIFGSLFQSVMNPVERRNLGAHYTSEKNILKVIKPLFLDDLWKEYEKAKNESRTRLIQFHDRLATLRFLDPACGCGNFLVISYRELRLLELEIIKTLQKGQQVFDIHELLKLDVDRFYGIEIEEFPSQIAQVAMWLMDHQMNMRASEEFGQYFVRLPLRKSPNIVCANALRIDWLSLIEPIPWEQGEQRFDFIYGNPPFVGSKFQNTNQRQDLELIIKPVKNGGLLDYVCGWFLKSLDYIISNDSRIAFVSTNSITQGEQVAPLWNHVFSKGIIINFAHKTFPWESEAKGKAAVHVVIIGLTKNHTIEKKLYSKISSNEITETKVRNISPYLVEGPNITIGNRSKPICDVPKMTTGNKPIDDGQLIFSTEEMADFVKIEPAASKYFFPFVGADEFINSTNRWILFLKNITPGDLREMPTVLERVEAVRTFRMNSKSIPTKKIANFPTRFHTENLPEQIFLVIPQVSSERREYIPISFLSPPIVCSDKLRILCNVNNYHFGILESKMHMAWMRLVTGRLKSDYQYSVLTVYNNFPWPESPSEKQVKTVEDAAQKVLDTRLQFPGSSLADLYDPLTMPPELVKVHQDLDKAVDLCYRPQPFPNETKRIEFLFELYDKYTAGLFVKEKKKNK